MRDFSYQLYSSRKFGPLPETLKMLAGLGYTQVEGFGALYGSEAEADALKAALDTAGLTMPSGHFAWDLVSGDPARTMDLARRLGIDTIIVPFLPPEARPEDWAAFGTALAEAGKPIRDAGFAYGWHNHAFEFERTAAGDLPLDLIMAGGPEIGLELDLAWVHVGGQDPADLVRSYADRLVSVHLKDRAPDGDCADEDGWADLGQGVLDWPGIMAAVGASTAKYQVMEHDNPSDDVRFARRSIDFAKTL